MSRITDFGDCLAEKDLSSLYSLAHCLNQLHERLADDTAALTLHLDKEGALLLRRCDICGENLTRHVVWEMLEVIKYVIRERERERDSEMEEGDGDS